MSHKPMSGGLEDGCNSLGMRCGTETLKYYCLVARGIVMGVVPKEPQLVAQGARWGLGFRVYRV